MSLGDPVGTQRSAPPPAGPTRTSRFPDFEIHRLDNGLDVYLAPYPRGPLIHQLLVMPGGGQQDPSSRAGLAALTAAVMDEGTSARAALEIADQVESLGGYLASQADWDTMAASLGVLAKHASQGLRLLSEIASEATFPDREIERLRQLHLAELQRRRAQPGNLASDALLQVLYEGTIYAHPLLGRPATLEAIQRDEILESARRQISPAGAALILVGDLQPESMMSVVEETFGGWQGEPRPDYAAVEPTALESLRVRLVDRPQAPQTELWLGSVGVPRSHPERAGLIVLNSLLGGKFTSRLNLNLRERLGITYGVSTSFSQRRGPGPFVIATSIDTDAVEVAVQEILAELRRLQDEPVTADELADTQSYLLGIFPYTLQRIEGLASRLADLAVYNLPRDYFQRYLEQITAVTCEDIQRLAREHLRPAAMGVVAVGPRAQIEAQLAPFGTPEMVPAGGSSSTP